MVNYAVIWLLFPFVKIPHNDSSLLISQISYTGSKSFLELDNVYDLNRAIGILHEMHFGLVLYMYNSNMTWFFSHIK